VQRSFFVPGTAAPVQDKAGNHVLLSHLFEDMVNFCTDYAVIVKLSKASRGDCPVFVSGCASGASAI
jgi:hypothetical protein